MASALGEFAVRDLHVGSTNRQAIRHIRGKLKRSFTKGVANKAPRFKLYRDGLKALAAHRKLMRAFHL
jgi:hypothetical protein